MEARLKTQVLVLVPFSVGPSALLTEAGELMERHRMDQNRSAGGGRFDYLVGAAGCFDDPIAEGRLPARVRRTLRRQVCEVERLPPNLVPGALVTPDGNWHDMADDGWRMVDEPSTSNQDAFTRWRARYRKLVADNPHCWVVEFWAHS
jgi:hypothetical protein